MADWGNLDPRRIPIIGNDIYQVGQVYDIISQPCGPDPVIAARAAFAYSPTLIWALFKPEPLDLAFDRARKGHKKIRKRRWRIADLDQVEVKTFGGVGTALFKIASAAEKIGWYLLIADATTDWAVNWTSAAWQFQGCNVPNPSWGNFKGPSPFYVEPFASPTITMGSSEWSHAGNGFAFRGGVSLNGTGPYSITYSASPNILPYLGNVGQVTACTVEVTVQGGGMTPVEAEEITLPDGSTEWQAVYRDWSTRPKNVDVVVRWAWSDGYLGILEQSMTISGGPAAGLTFDP